MFYITFDYYHLNQARTRAGPEHYLCYQIQTRPSAGRAHADHYHEQQLLLAWAFNVYT
jgi:hypothetical protein